MSATWARSRSAGPEALELAEFVTTNAVSRLKPGQIQYSGLLYGNGGFVDDILVHNAGPNNVFLCVNASNQEKDFEHIRDVNRWNARVELASPRYAQIAVQGPQAKATLQPLCSVDLSAIRYYHFIDGEVCGHAGANRADRLYGRGRVRDLHCARSGGRHLGPDPGRGTTAGDQALRARRAQHVAAGGRHGLVRP